MTDFGSGIALDENLDFEVDPTGDLAATSGSDELEKDLSFQMIFSLSDFVGRPPTGNLAPKVLDTATRVATADERVSSVNQERSSIEFSRDREDLQVEIFVRTNNEEQRLVFNL